MNRCLRRPEVLLRETQLPSGPAKVVWRPWEKTPSPSPSFLTFSRKLVFEMFDHLEKLVFSEKKTLYRKIDNYQFFYSNKISFEKNVRNVDENYRRNFYGPLTKLLKIYPIHYSCFAHFTFLRLPLCICLKLVSFGLLYTEGREENFLYNRDLQYLIRINYKKTSKILSQKTMILKLPCLRNHYTFLVVSNYTGVCFHHCKTQCQWIELNFNWDYFI